jgi:hypothetical protein
MQQATSRVQQPPQHYFSSSRFRVDLRFQMQVFILALQTNSDVLLIETIVLEESPFVEQPPHIDEPITVHQLIELLLLQRLQFHIHVAVLTS